MFYKIFRASEWDDLQAKGQTLGAPIDLSDGYIHFSAADQVAETAAKHFAGETGLMLAAVDPEGLGDALKWEVSRGGALFPHLYRALRTEDIAWSAPIGHENGAHVIPEGPA